MERSIYHLNDTSQLLSPSLLVFKELVTRNLSEMIRVAGSPQRLRPHCKTHKLEPIVQMQIAAGIEKFKCATFAEAEMIASAGGKDILLAYNIVGPNIDRALHFLKTFSDVKLSVTVDHPQPMKKLADRLEAEKLENQLGLMIDLDTGMHRTGIALNDDAISLYEMIASTPFATPEGLHWYDGQHRECDLDDRRISVNSGWSECVKLRDRLMLQGFEVPRIVAGGTGSFPIHAEHEEPEVELSPGTVIFHDQGYSTAFPEMNFVPAALCLTRVISRPTPSTMTLDLGHKAISPDSSAEKRATFPELPDAKFVMQNEEHLVVESSIAEQFSPGDALVAIPWHICPTSALHQSVYVIENGDLVDEWKVSARDRKLTI